MGKSASLSIQTYQRKVAAGRAVFQRKKKSIWGMVTIDTTTASGFPVRVTGSVPDDVCIVTPRGYSVDFLNLSVLEEDRLMSEWMDGLRDYLADEAYDAWQSRDEECR
tara:strand:+ start:1420 stop:1743 length:324 start_codon:yes stop_codon:yes gene_type:complete